MLPSRSLWTIAFGFLLPLLAVPAGRAQSPTSPTASIDPEAIDAIWQKAGSKAERQMRAQDL